MKARNHTVCNRFMCSMRGWHTALLVSVSCLVSMTACASGGYTNMTVRHRSISEIVRQERPLLLPPVQGGVVGWCLATKLGECEAARAFRGPIVAQSDSAQGSPLVRMVTVITMSSVAAVSIDGGPNIPTHSDPRLPIHLKSVVVEVRGGPSVNVPGFGRGPQRLSITAVNAKDEIIQRKVEPRGSLFFIVPSRHWRSTAGSPRGPCEIHASNSMGLVAGGGVVVDKLISRAELPAHPLLSCISTSFRLKGDSLIASLLVDAAHPGTRPTSLPAMKPLAGHPGIFEAIGGAIGGLGDYGQILARRVPGAWLIAGRGKSAQRLVLLEHLHAMVHL